MGCSKQLSIGKATPAGDLFMNQALYEPVTDTIVGIRDQWLFQFNATTGAFIQALRFTTNATSTSCMTIFGGKIYCGVLYTPVTDYQAGNSPDRDIFIVDAATFAVTGRMNLGSYGQTLVAEISSGYRSLTNDQTRIIGSCYTQNAPVHTNDGLFAFDPANIAGTYALTSFQLLGDICYDPVNDAVWIIEEGFNIWAIQATPLDFNDCHDTPNGGGGAVSHGITYNAAQNKVFAVTGSELFYEIDASVALPSFTNFPLTTRHTGLIACNGVRIKSVNNEAGNPFNGKVLIPTWADDSVVVWDPAANAVDSVKTGFTAPYDIVVCPTTNFALQTGIVGLKEIV